MKFFSSSLFILASFLIIFTGLPACNKAVPLEVDQAVLPFVKGVYGNPGTLIEAGYRFDELGMNAIFVRSISLNEELFETAHSQNVHVFVEFPTLLGRNYVENHPDAWPINEYGEKSPPADWFMGVCPTHPGFWDYRTNQLREILETYDVDGIFLDYVHWHAQFETPDPILPETCFCDRCTSLFSEHADLQVIGTDIPEKAAWILENADSDWREWRSTVLNNWVSGMKLILQEMQPDALLGIFYCSWFPDDYDGALYKTLGIDVDSFIEMADVLSPMLFHKMKNRPASWVGEYTSWLGDQISWSSDYNPIIWPIVQAHDNPDVVTVEEFREVMTIGSKPPSSGIMMFSDRALLDNPEKIEVMKKLYSGELIE